VTEISQATPADLDRLHSINQASTPGVGSVTIEELASLTAIASATLVARRGDDIAGFALCLVEGAPYASLNYAWVSERFDRFAYVDRVAVAPEHRSGGIGGVLYEAVIAHFSGQRLALLAEVNLAPPNPGSARFHARFGFEEIGERWYDDDTKGVVYVRRWLEG